MGTWTKTGVRKLIVEALTPLMAPAGFRFRKSEFVRKMDGGRQELTVTLADYNPVFRVSLVLCSRFDAVQEITNRFSGASEKDFGETLTSMTQLEFFGLPAKPGAGVEWEVKSEADLGAVLPGVVAVVRDRVLPFFDEYRDLQALHRGLNPPGAERMLKPRWPNDWQKFDASNEPYREMTGVAVAHLAGDPRFDELVAAYRSQIKILRDLNRQKFEDMVAYLSSVRRA
jgi:hypothetical protein